MLIVVYDDKDCLCFPQVWDKDCEGAICTGNADGKDIVALFETRKAARTAIDISAKAAALAKAQGKPANEEYLGDYRKNLRLQECSTTRRDDTSC